MDVTRVVLDTQEDCLFDTQLDLAEPDHNVIGESTELCHNVDIDPSVSFDVNDQDNLMDSMLSSSLPLPTAKDVDEGELSGDFMDFTPEDFTGIESQVKNDNNLIPLLTVTAEDAGKDMAGLINTNTRNLVDYSELVHENSREPAKQATDVLGSDSSLRRSGRLDNSKTRNQDFVKPVKRRGPSSEDERSCKKVKKLADLTTCPENIISLGEHHEDASGKVVDASVNKRNGRIKRAEERKKLGINRPKLEIVVKEKKISICRHYMMGKCHEQTNIADMLEEAVEYVKFLQRQIQVIWVGFDRLEIGPASFRRVLLLGYQNGFQVIDVEDASDFTVLVPKWGGPVSFLQLLHILVKSDENNKFIPLHPLLMVVAGDEALRSAFGQNRTYLSAPGRDGQEHLWILLLL